MSNFWQFCLHMGKLIKVTLLCLVMHIKPIKRGEKLKLHTNMCLVSEKKTLIVLFMLFLYFSSKWGTLYLGTPSLQTQWIHDKHEST